MTWRINHRFSDGRIRSPHVEQNVQVELARMLLGPCHPTQVCTVRVESRYETVSGRDSAFAIGYAPTNILTRTEKDGNGSALRAFLFLSLAQARNL